MSVHDTPDRFDGVRREWIASHGALFTMQRRRAEILNRAIRGRLRRAAGARPDPHDDNVIHPLILRIPTTVDSALESIGVLTVALLAPLGWLAGKLIYHSILRYIPDRLRSYPIAATAWTSVGIGALTLAVYQPGRDVVTAVAAPWLIAQIPATFLVAATYGVLNGWLAVDGSTDWWPMTPAPPLTDMHVPLGADDLTAPHVFAPSDLSHRVRPHPDRPVGATSQRRWPVTAGLCLAGIGALVTLVLVATDAAALLTSAGAAMTDVMVT